MATALPRAGRFRLRARPSDSRFAVRGSRSFCDLLSSRLASSRLTRAKLTSRSERSLLVAMRRPGRETIGAWPVFSATRATACASAPDRTRRPLQEGSARGWPGRCLSSARARSLALPVRLAVRPKSVMSWETFRPSALRSKMAGLFRPPTAASRVLSSVVPTATTLPKILGKMRNELRV